MKEKRFGRQPMNEKPLIQFHISLTEKQRDWLLRKSMETGVSMNEIVRRILEEEQERCNE